MAEGVCKQAGVGGAPHGRACLTPPPTSWLVVLAQRRDVQGQVVVGACANLVQGSRAARISPLGIIVLILFSGTSPRNTTCANAQPQGLLWQQCWVPPSAFHSTCMTARRDLGISLRAQRSASAGSSSTGVGRGAAKPPCCLNEAKSRAPAGYCRSSKPAAAGRTMNQHNNK